MSETTNQNNSQQTEPQKGQTQQNNSQQTQSNQGASPQQGQNNTSVDVEKIKNDAINNLLKEAGYDSIDTMKEDLGKYKDHVNSQKSESERKDDELKETTKQLAEEREARLLAEAKLEARNMGVKAGLVDDVVIIAKSRVTKDKDIVAVLTEMKDNSDEKIYFEDDAEPDEKNKNTGHNNTTRRRVPKKDEANSGSNGAKDEGSAQAGKYAGTMAARLLGNTSRGKGGYYFKK